MKALRTAIGLLLALAVSAPVGAASSSPFNTGSVLIGTTSGALYAAVYCNSTGCTQTAPGSLTGYITLKAYSTTALAANTTTTPTDNTTSWATAQIAVYGGGVGITNSLQPLATETATPQHAIDNNGVDDILVVDFGSTGWDINSFSLGYTCNASSGTCGGSTNPVAVEAWVGNVFASEVFSANNDLNAVPTGFQRLTLTGAAITNATAGSTAGGTVTDTDSLTGRYLVITGALGAGTINGVSVNGYSDAFKVNAIVATQTGSGTQAVPTPGSLALMSLGLVALAFARRRLVRIA